jgi:DNA helicase-2/ATP-dependent DNA helicase PcrA
MKHPIAFDKLLNPEQLASATASAGPILVLAAAGTGKTRTLVYRVAYLVEQGVPPERILLLTFTNKAAHEMLDRARELVGAVISGLWGGTFHHMGNRLLRRHADRLGLRNDFTILDRDDSKSMVSQSLSDLRLKGGDFPKPEVLLSVLGTATNTRIPLGRLVSERYEELAHYVDDISRVRDAYEQHKRSANALDFDDLLAHAVALLDRAPDLTARYQEQFMHVLVDEYQDTNPLQAELVDRLAAHHRNLMVVGDDFQSIYSWRGANYENILTFPQRYSDCRIFKLETNYRSVPEILDVANFCMSAAPEVFRKTLRPTRSTHCKPRIARLRDGSEQAHYVVQRIRDCRREGYRLSDITILYRAHFHSLDVQLELDREHIPYLLTSGIRFFEQAHIKDVCTVLRLLVNPGDALAFTRLFGLFPGVGPKTAAKLWIELGERLDVGDRARMSALREKLRPTAREAWAKVEPVFREALAAPTTKGGDIIQRFVEAFYEHYAWNSFDSAESRLDDLNELGLHIARYENTEAFLSESALLTNIDSEAGAADAGTRDAVRLGTVHQAKGLEWPVVMVLWLNEGLFPSSRSLQDSFGGEEEERRLFYVAVTRAKDELDLCVPEIRRTRDGGIFYCAPSRFIKDMPRRLVTDVRGSFI